LNNQRLRSLAHANSLQKKQKVYFRPRAVTAMQKMDKLLSSYHYSCPMTKRKNFHSTHFCVAINIDHKMKNMVGLFFPTYVRTFVCFHHVNMRE